MTALESKQMEQAGTDAVKKLRLEKFRKGIPFMINSNDLPNRQCYYEYPDGTVKLVTLSESGMDFITTRILSKEESAQIRQQFDLTEYYA